MAWKKPPTGRLTEHFHWTEAACKHCGKIVDEAEVRATALWAERVRAEVYSGRVMRVNSWCRCRVHNERVGGAANSQHLYGKALDFTVHGLTPYQAWQMASKHQGKGKLIGGLGRYSGWVHIDRGPARRWRGP